MAGTLLSSVKNGLAIKLIPKCQFQRLKLIDFDKRLKIC